MLVVRLVASRTVTVLVVRLVVRWDSDSVSCKAGRQVGQC